ncbi:MAG: tetratricopeptide repeat protein [Gemmatimonadota bacterium]
MESARPAHLHERGEPDFLAQPPTDVYRAREVAEVLGLSPAKVRGLARAGLLDVARDSGGYCFNFQDVVLLRGTAELESADLPARRVRSALRRLREQLSGRPLSAGHVGPEGGRVIAREAGSAWEPQTGQYVLPLEAAEAHYRCALAASPESATAAFNLGVVLQDLGRAERAIEAYLRALAADPDLADAHFNLSRLYEDTGDRAAALRHLRSYSQLTRTS